MAQAETCRCSGSGLAPLLGPWLCLAIMLLPRAAMSQVALGILAHPVAISAGITGLILILLRFSPGWTGLLASVLACCAWAPFDPGAAISCLMGAAILFQLACLHRLSLELWKTPIPALALGLLDLNWRLYAPLFGQGTAGQRVPLSGFGLLGLAPQELGFWNLLLPLLPVALLAYRHRADLAALARKI